jgi:ribosome-associated protein
MSTTWGKGGSIALWTMDPGSVDTFGLVQRDVRIRGETISLGQLLKLEGVIGSGAEIKRFLSTEPVWVNGETETRRGRKLRLDDVVRVGELELRVISATDPQADARPSAPARIEP